MALNFVEVTISPVDFNVSAVGGNLVFEPSDIVWDDSAGLVSIGAPEGGAIPNSGTLMVSLFAMDNAGVSTNWKWRMTGQINGITIKPRLLIVNFANGASQNLSTLLDTSVLE